MKRWLGLLTLFLLLTPVAKALLTCSSVTAPAMNLGTYIGLLSTSGVTSLSVTCAILTSYNVGLNAGTSTGATVTNRLLTGPGGAKLSYSLFSDAARTVNWGNTVGTDTIQGTGSGGAQAVSIYPQVSAGQYVAPGTYTDTVTASLYSLLSTPTATFTIIAVVQATCALSTTSLAFGTYTGILLNSASTLTITCTNGTAYNVGLNAGLATGATVTNRSMTGPASTLLGYKLFSDSGHTTNWGNSVGSDTVAGSGSGTAQALTVYGQISAGQRVRPGTYADTIIATVTY